MSVGDARDSTTAQGARSAVLRRDDLELRDVSALATLAATPEARADPDEEARHHLARAEEAFSRFDYAGATAAIDEALRVLRPTAVRASGRRRLAEVHLRRALVLHVHDERDAALAELRTCVHLDAECEPNPALHPPELVALAEEARAIAETGTLSVLTTPESARVSVDGSPPRDAPVEFVDLAAGRHYVVATRDGFEPRVELVSVQPNATTERRLELVLGAPSMRAEAALRALQQRGADAEPRWRADALELADADLLMLVDAPDQSARLSLFDVRGERIAEPATYALSLTARPLARLYVDEVLPSPRGRFYERWYFWTPISFALAGILSAIVYARVRPADVTLTGAEVVRED